MLINKRKRKEYFIKDFFITRTLAVFFSIIYVVLSIVWILITIPTHIAVVVGLCYMALSVIVVLNWYMCIERYLNIEFRNLEENATILDKAWYFVCILMMILLGMKTYKNILNLVVFVEANNKLLEGLADCLLLRLGFALGWMILWLGSIFLRKTIVSKEKGYKKVLTVGSVLVVVVIMLHIQANSERYIYDRTEDVWYKEMVEYYEKHQGEQNVEPFSRNWR